MRPETLALEQPSAFGVGTARALAKVYGILADGGKTKEGKTLLSSKAIMKIISEGKDDGVEDRTVGVPILFNLGFTVFEYQVGHDDLQKDSMLVKLLPVVPLTEQHILFCAFGGWYFKDFLLSRFRH